MKRLIWQLPTWCHEVVLKMTGYRLVKVGFRGKFVWTKEWPLS